MVQHSGDNSVHYLFYSLRPSIEERIRGKNRRACKHKQLEVLNVHKTQRRFARHQNQLLLFFQNHIRGPQQHVFTQAVCDSPKRPHGAGYDHHRIGRIGTAREGSIHALQVVRFGAGRKFQAVGQFFRNNGLSVITQNEVDLVLSAMKIIEQTLGVNNPAGTGDGNDDSQGCKDCTVRVRKL